MMMKRAMKLIAGGVLAAALALPLTASAATYVVQPSDSLWSISVKYGTTIEKLKQMNGLTSNMLLNGQVLQVPDPANVTAVTVLPGDTMWKISVRHGIPLDKLIKANPQIANPSNIWTGLTVYVPRKPVGYLDGILPLKAGTYTAFTNTYADSRTWTPDGTTARTHEGVDIFAAKGTPVYSALSGTIIRAGWNEYGGWRITVRGDNDTEFYYAHLSGYASGIKTGTTVSKGQLIGYVGSTGYGPEGTEGKFLPHLHFGMYKRTPAYAAVDPFLYLKWWEL
jgi:peptidoglycan LD-endopeptidase LytH